MAPPYPLPREIRQSNALVGDGETTNFGPFDFRIFDIEDVTVVLQDADGGQSEVDVTVTKQGDGVFEHFTISLSSAPTEGEQFWVVGKRLHKRSADVFRGGTLNSLALEAELSAQGAVQQELRRDVDLTLRYPYGGSGGTIERIPDGHFWLSDDGNMVDGGAGEDIVNAAANAVQARIDAERAEAAAEIAAAAAGSINVVSSEEDFLEALGLGGAIKVSSNLTEIELTTTQQMADLLDNFDLIIPEAPVDITLPIGVHTSTADSLIQYTNNSGLITLKGAAPIVTSLLSVSGVTGSAFDWDCVLNLADATGMAAGNILKLWNVGPLPSLSGDNAYNLRVKPIDNEIFTPHVRIGGMTTTSGTNTASFTRGTLSDHVELGWLFHRGNQTNVVTGINDATQTITFAGTWGKGTFNETCYLVTRPGIGSCTLSGSQPSSVLDFANGITATHLNVGDIILTRGMAIKIDAVIDSNTVQLSHAVSFAGGAPYSIITPGTLHEGGWLVTNVAGNQVTVKNRGATKPPVNNVAGGEAIAILTVLHQTDTGDGAFPLENNASLHLEDIALRGNYSSAGSHGIAANGRDPDYGPTQNGVASTVTLGYNTALINFGRNFYGGVGCILNARGTMWTGAIETNVWADIGSTANLRHCVAAGAKSGDGIRYGPGAGGKTTETRANGNSDDGFQSYTGALNYGEIPFSAGNLGMGVRTQGGHAERGEAVLMLNGLSGAWVSGAGGSVEAPNMMVLGNGREGIEVSGLNNIDVSGSFISGTTGATGGGHAIKSIEGATVDGTNISGGGNAAGLYAAAGGTIDVIGMVPELSVGGVARPNEMDTSGSIIRTSAALAVGVSALAIAGGSTFNFFKSASAVIDFSNSSNYATSTVTVVGATPAMVALANGNAIPSGHVLTANINADNIVTVSLKNNTGIAIDASSMTVTVMVFGAD